MNQPSPKAETAAKADTPDPIRVVIADDHAMVRGGLRRILESEPGVQVVAEAFDGESTLSCLAGHRCDILLLDLTMPAPSGPQLIGAIRERFPAVPVLVVSMHNDARIVRVALQSGASGYVPKDSDPETLVGALRRVAAGGRYVEPALADSLLFLPPDTDDPRKLLSPREFEVFERLAHGQSNHEIARDLHLSEKTVSTHKTKLMSKLRLNNMADLVRYADEHLGSGNRGY